MKFLPILVFFAFLARSNAWQSVAPSLATSTSSRSRLRPLTVVQSAQTYSVQPLRSFIRPFLPDLHRDSIFDVSLPRDPDNEDDHDILDYLPWYVLQDETKQCVNLITKATRQYVYGDTQGDPKVDAQEVVKVIHDEYKSSDAPFTIGDRTYAGIEPKHRLAAQILSFAAYHRLPTPITALLFGTDELEEYKRAFLAHGGWSGVSFPRGLAIRLPRSRLTKSLDRYQPIPRRFFHTRNARIGERCIMEAARVQPPPRQLLSRQGFLDSLERELHKSSAKPWQGWGVSPFFPSKRNAFNVVKRRVLKVSSVISLVSVRLKEYLRATALSYGVLTFGWFNLSVLWRWQRLSVTFRLSSSALLSSFHRVGGVVSQVYSDLHIVIPVLALALILAPFANRALPTIRERLGVTDDNRALLCMSTLLAVSQFGFVASILFLDAAVLRAVFLL